MLFRSPRALNIKSDFEFNARGHFGDYFEMVNPATGVVLAFTVKGGKGDTAFLGPTTGGPYSDDDMWEDVSTETSDPDSDEDENEEEDAEFADFAAKFEEH